MKYFSTLILLFFCLFSRLTYAYEAQGTTVIKDVCDVRIILQIALETDSASDIPRMQSILDECFSIVCDLPCVDRSTGHCKIISKVIVVNWNSLSAADKPKFHHVYMLEGEGVSFVNEALPPNSGKSSGGSWYRKEFSPKVYCHEAMHLCGHDDHYRDCRADRLALHVDNCKDGDTCTAAQKASGACPPCPGFEDDLMGNDVTKPIDCNHDMVEILRALNNPDFVCSDECCAKPERPQTDYRKPKTELIVEGGIGYYHMEDKTVKNDELKLMGGNYTLGVNENIPLGTHFDLNTYGSVNYAQTSDSRTRNTGPIIIEEKYTYRLTQVYLGVNLAYLLANSFAFYAGTGFGLPLSVKSKFEGTMTSGGIVTPIGNGTFDKITENKSFQWGANMGLSYQTRAFKHPITPYLNMYIPFTNVLHSATLTNKMSTLNAGVRIAIP
jgi:hypothetical protein